MIEFTKNEWYDKNDTAAGNKRIPINKDNLNKIETGIDNCVTYINNLYYHWWEKRKVIGDEVMKDVFISQYFRLGADAYKDTISINYSDSVNIKINEGTGGIYAELNNPNIVKISYSSLEDNDHYAILRDKYFTFDSDSNAELYYTDSNIDREYSGSTSDGTREYGCIINICRPIFKKICEDTVEYVFSKNNNEYPNGVKEEGNELFMYKYLGVPYENSRNSFSIASGWYMGDGKEIRTITTQYKPRYVLVFSYEEVDNDNYVVCLGLAADNFIFGGTITLTESGFVVAGTGSLYSANDTATKYGYIVFY